MSNQEAEEFEDSNDNDDGLDDECGLADDGQCAFAGTEHCDFECPYRDSDLFAGGVEWNRKHKEFSGMSIPHPTGSEKFEAELSGLGHPTPWRLDDDAPGEVLDANGGTVLVAGTAGIDADRAESLALWVVMAVNTLAGYRAERVD